jgi:hypothetical protein
MWISAKSREPTCDPIGINALAESVIGLYKTELIRLAGPWRTVEQVEIPCGVPKLGCTR